METPTYTITDKLHVGSRYVTYRATRGPAATPIVLKLLKDAYPSAQALNQLRQEFAILRQVSAHAVVQATALDPYQNSLVLVSEAATGLPLATFLQDKPVALPLFFAIACPLASAIGTLHRQRVIHKNISPSNILFDTVGQQITLCGFSLATELAREAQPINARDAVDADLTYLSPEQTGRTNRTLDHRTDLYSLGCVFYHLLTGQPPFAAEDPMELVHAHLALSPLPPGSLQPALPPTVSAIVLRLLAKNPEDRYQSASGLLYDLNRCRDSQLAGQAIPDFVPGEQDISDRFQLPGKLYGRNPEVTQLTDALRRAAAGQTNAVFVGGYAGVGKSGLVQEIQQYIAQTNGLFISNKADQLKRDVPLGSLLAALRQLIRQLLTQPDSYIARWRQQVQQAVGPLGQVLVDVLPDLTLLIGPQPAVPALPPVEATNRFNQFFNRLVDVFIQPEHPLCLFLDDLQWVDSATRQWLETRLTGQPNSHFLFVGAYRDNAMSAAHPLLLMLDRLRQSSTAIEVIALQALDQQTLAQLIADTLVQTSGQCADLTEVVFQKTGGNPFFTRQCLLSLHEAGAIYFDTHHQQWAYTIDAVQQVQLSDNVVDLMVGLIQRLPQPVQDLLKTAACMGNQFDPAALALVMAYPFDEMALQLHTAQQHGLIIPAKVWQRNAADTFVFLHDRVQQAALSLLTEAQQQQIRLQIGRILLANMTSEATESNLYELAGHLNVASHLITDPDERQRVVEVTLAASIRAKLSAAYEPALQYVTLAMDLMPAPAWEQPSVLTRELLVQRAECEHLCGNNQPAEGYFDQALQQAPAILDRAKIYQRKIHYYINLGQFDLAYQTGRAAVKPLGVDLPAAFFPPSFARDLLTNRVLLGNRPIASLIDQRAMTNERLQMAVLLMASFARAAYQLKPELCVAVCLRIVNICLRHGNTVGGSTGYLAVGPIFMGAILGRVQTGFDFGQLTLALVDKFNDYTYRAEAHFVVGYFAIPWRRPATEMERHWQLAYEAGLETGDLFHASCACCGTIQSYYMRGMPFDDVLAAADRYLEFLTRINNTEAILTLQAVRLSIRNLRGETQSPDSYSDDTLDEADYVAQLSRFGTRHFAHYYFINKMQTLYLWGEYKQAYAVSMLSDQYLKDSPGMLHTAEHYFYKALIICALYSESTPFQRIRWQRTLAKINARFRRYATGSPSNFTHKAQVLAAEICRINHDNAGANTQYSLAIESARRFGYVHIQAIASELMGRFHQQAGHNREAAYHFRSAEYAFRTWGATALAGAITQRYPTLTDMLDERPSATDSMRRTNALSSLKTGEGSLDLSTILKSSEAISREIRLTDLLATMMRIISENAGGQRMVFLLQRGHELVVQAEYLADEGTVNHLDEIPLDDYDHLARSVVRYAARTQEPIILDVATRSDFASDTYIQANASRAILCTPLLQLGKLTGVIYLENNLTNAAFTQERLNLITVLSGQMAISIDNALLYKNLEEKVIERTAALNQSLDHLKATQHQLIQKEKMASLGELTAGIAHEIQNPLNFVNNFAEISTELVIELDEAHQQASRDPELEADLLINIRDSLGKITEHGKRAAGIVRAMLEHSRNRTGERQLTDLNALADEYLRLTYKNVLAKNGTFSCKLITQFSSDMFPVSVGPQELGRVLLNVYNNAFYAVIQQAKLAGPDEPYKPTVWVSTKPVSGAVEIRVRDNGTGMSEAVQAKVFQPFFTTKPTGQGTGLGLSLSYDIITKGHGGRLWVDTLAGQFTEFVISLPVSTADPLTPN